MTNGLTLALLRAFRFFGVGPVSRFDRFQLSETANVGAWFGLMPKNQLAVCTKCVPSSLLMCATRFICDDRVLIDAEGKELRLDRVLRTVKSANVQP